jgi:hypothetical protein
MLEKPRLTLFILQVSQQFSSLYLSLSDLLEGVNLLTKTYRRCGTGKLADKSQSFCGLFIFIFSFLVFAFPR